MSALRVRQWEEHARERGEPWPVPGPPLPAGWWWCPSVCEPPHRAEHEAAPLAIRASRHTERYGGWVAEVRGCAIRLREGAYVVVQGRRGQKGVRRAEHGPIVRFATPGEAASAAVAFYTGARFRPLPPEGA